MSFKQDSFYKEKCTKLSLADERVISKEFEDCTFIDCTFLDTKFIDCKFINCRFKNCTLSAIVTTDSLFIDVAFVQSKAIGIDWTKASRVQNIIFTDCQLNFSNFRMLKLPTIKIVNCEAKEIDFTESNIAGGVFSNSDFEKSIFFKTNLTKADFRGAKAYAIDARVNSIKGALFSLPEALSLLAGLDVIID